MASTLKQFGAKLGTAAALGMLPGIAAGQALSNYGAIGMGAVGAGVAGAAITSGASALGAIIHQRGQAKGREEARNAMLNNTQFRNH